MDPTSSDPFLRNLSPPPLLPTWNGRRPGEVVKMRAAELPGVVALPVRALMPDLPEPIWSPDPTFGPTDLEVVRERTREQVVEPYSTRFKYFKELVSEDLAA